LSSKQRDETTVVVVQTLIPDYREGFYHLLLERLDGRLKLIAGDEDFAGGHRRVDAVPCERAGNRYLLGRRLLWQSRVLRPLMRADVAVLELNPRIATVWIALLLRRLRGRRTVLWGHAWPRKGRGSRTDAVRQVMRKLADTLVVYTDTQARELRELTPEGDIGSAPNALYREHEMHSISAGRPPSDFVYVGRLLPTKKPMVLLDAFLLALPRLPDDVRLVFVGDGPLRESLEAAASRAGIGDRVHFTGHVSDIETLRQVYSQAIASVSPGYVGLSLIQSIGFGVPMLAARDEPHAPEIEAAVEGQNFSFFESDSPKALASTLVSVAAHREQWVSRREEIATRTRRRYSIEAMADAFIAALRLDDSSTG
jgi:glycosyltransferase involved in cell wall biosynthesis